MLIDDVTAAGGSRGNSEVYRAIFSAQIQPNVAKLITWHFTGQMANDPTHTAKTTQDFIEAKKLDNLQGPSQSPDLTQ